MAAAHIAGIAVNGAAYGTKPFANGTSNTGTQFADADQSYTPLNGLETPSSMTSYIVQAGDTLQSIAAGLWGDASFWYVIADANGLTGSELLQPGETLLLPGGVHNIHNNAQTYNVFDPNQLIGNTAPKQPKPKPQHNGCGVIGMIVMMVVAVVVAIYAPYLIPAIATYLGGGTVATLAATAIYAVGADALEQGVGLATGVQSKFSWSELGEAAVGSLVGAGLNVEGVFGTGANSSVFGALGIGGEGILPSVARGLVTSVVTQGIEVATGLQKKFDWTAVAAAGVAAGVSSEVGHWNGYDPSMAGKAGETSENKWLGGVANSAGLIAGAATRTLINGSDFGDNLIAVLPQVIGNTVGQTIGNVIAGGIQGSGQTNPQAQGQATSAPGDNGTYTPTPGSLSLPNGQPVDWVDFTADKWDANGNPISGHFDYYQWNDATNSDVLIFSQATSNPQIDGTDYTATSWAKPPQGTTEAAPTRLQVDNYVWDDLTGSDVQYDSNNVSALSLFRHNLPTVMQDIAQATTSGKISSAEQARLQTDYNFLNGKNVSINFTSNLNDPGAAGNTIRQTTRAR